MLCERSSERVLSSRWSLAMSLVAKSLIRVAALLMVAGMTLRAQAQSEPSHSDDPAACLAALDNPDASIEACTRALEIETRDSARRQAVTLTYRAIGHTAKGEIEAAVTDLTQAINLAPDFAPAYEARGDLLRN